MPETTEPARWVSRLKSGGEEQAAALEELRIILSRGLASALSRRGADESFRDDVTQDALLRILKNLDSFAGRSKFTTWAMTIAVRTAVSQLRRRHYQDVSLDATASDEMRIEIAVDPQRSPAEQADQKSILTALQKFIHEELTEKQRLVVRGALAGLAMEEIARRMNSNRNATYKLYHDARRKLKQSFESANYSPAEIQAAFA